MSKQTEYMPTYNHHTQIIPISYAKVDNVDTKTDAQKFDDVGQWETLRYSALEVKPGHKEPATLLDKSPRRARQVELLAFSTDSPHDEVLEDIYLPPPIGYDQLDTWPLASIRLWSPQSFNHSIDHDSEAEKHATIPMHVLEGIGIPHGHTVPEMKSEITDAASGAAVVGLGNTIGFFLRYSTIFLIQRTLGASFFGLFSLALAVVTLVSSIFNLGLDDVMVRYVPMYRVNKQAILLRNLIIFCYLATGLAGIISGIWVIFAAPLLAIAFKKPDIAPILQLLAPIIPLTCMQVILLGGLQGFKDFKRWALVRRIVTAGYIVALVFVLLFFRKNITAVVIVSLANALFSTVLTFYMLLGSASRIKKFTTVKQETGYPIGEWLGFAIPNLFTTIINVVLDAIDTILLGYFAVSYLNIGRYSAAVKISNFISLPLIALNTMFAPTIAELYNKGEKQKLEVMFKVVTKWSITLSLPIFWISTLFAAPLLGLSGSEYASAWPLLIAFAIGGLINASTGAVGYMLIMTGHQKIAFMSSFIAVIVNIVLGVILTPRYGAMGTAVSTGLATCVLNLMRLIYVKRLVKMQPYRWDTLKPVGAGIISAALTGGLIYLLSYTHFSLQIFRIQVSIELSLIPVFIVVYVGLLALFRISPEDRIVLDKLQKKFVSGKKNRKV
jgi:O-antigen/teichoic acid export membrane protein